jgi:vacuolar-type H+-ATPase subunit H
MGKSQKLNAELKQTLDKLVEISKEMGTNEIMAVPGYVIYIESRDEIISYANAQAKFILESAKLNIDMLYQHMPAEFNEIVKLVRDLVVSSAENGGIVH